MVVLGWQLDLMILEVFSNLWFYDSPHAPSTTAQELQMVPDIQQQHTGTKFSPGEIAHYNSQFFYFALSGVRESTNGY